jgi:hypothetical protein
MKTILLPDGYNGNEIECDITPIEIDGNLVKLQVNNSYLIKWCRVSELSNLITKLECVQ